MSAPNILRFATAGSVDDGKSSLIGRLLYDSKAILEDQLLAIEHASTQRGNGHLELALLTDGLRAEREQNITIDVAYRYFATAKRKFIIADTPGHLQYTRNMVTGASTADLSVILVDARKGVLSQSRRHAAISILLGIRHLVVAVNKMDLVEFSQAKFESIRDEIAAFAAKLGVDHITAIPISALFGDNVVDRSLHTPWYQGPSLLEFLEQVDTSAERVSRLRLPVQYVIRPDQDFRGLAGRLESGSLCVGDQVVVASHGIQARVKSLLVAGVRAERAEAGEAVTLELDRHVDVSRGDLVVSPLDPPLTGNRVEAVVCWMQDDPLSIGKRYVLIHAGRRVSAVVEEIVHRLDTDTLEPVEASHLNLNDLGRLVLRTASPLHFDPYLEIQGTGSFVLADAATHATAAGGMLDRLAPKSEAPDVRVGAVIQLVGFEGEESAITLALRRFGVSPILLKQSDGFSANELVSWPGRLAAQGFPVLVSSSWELGLLRLERSRFGKLDDAIETLLEGLK